MIPQIKRENVEIRSQLSAHRAPIVRGAKESVQDNEWLALSPFLEMKPHFKVSLRWMVGTSYGRALATSDVSIGFCLTWVVSSS